MHKQRRRGFTLRNRDTSSHPKRGLICSEMVEVREIVKFGPTLGYGGSGVVRECSSYLRNLTMACKSIPKAELNSVNLIEDLKTEIQCLQIMQKHPSTVRLLDVHEDQNDVHVLMEVCKGGDLFSRVKELKYFSELEAASVCKTMASILSTCHKSGIMHRDLKPENILLMSPESNTDIRLADFGSAAFFSPGQKLNQLIGSAMYVSPAVLRQNYGPEADLWSLGIILYIILSGVPPFWGENNTDIFRQILSCKVDLASGRWRYISNLAKDLVSQLLTWDPENPMSAEDVLNHPWIVTKAPSKFSYPPSKVKARRKTSFDRFMNPSLMAAHLIKADIELKTDSTPGAHPMHRQHSYNSIKSIDSFEQPCLKATRRQSSFEDFASAYTGEEGEGGSDEHIPIAEALPDVHMSKITGHRDVLTQRSARFQHERDSRRRSFDGFKNILRGHIERLFR